MLRLTVVGLLLVAFALAPAMPAVADNHQKPHCHVNLSDPTNPAIYGNCIPLNPYPTKDGADDPWSVQTAGYAVHVPAVVSCGEVPCDQEATVTLVVFADPGNPTGTAASLSYHESEERWVLTIHPETAGLQIF